MSVNLKSRFRHMSILAVICCALGAVAGIGILTSVGQESNTASNQQESTSNDTPEIAAPKPAAAAEEKKAALSIDVAFITHLDANLPEQDVYIERDAGSGQVYRVTTGDHNMNEPLFAVANEVPHNPFDPKAIGPHPKGESLGMTLGQWLKHRGTGTYTYKDGIGSLKLSFTGLVPGGVYTMWHAFMPAVPPEPFTGTLDIPLGANDGSESVFQADENGKAEFVHTFKPGLQMSDVWTKSMLAINYHSDGKTYGGHPGKFGFNAHIPLFAMLPDRQGIE